VFLVEITSETKTIIPWTAIAAADSICQMLTGTINHCHQKDVDSIVNGGFVKMARRR
jgi:hypothetical protein